MSGGWALATPRSGNRAALDRTAVCRSTNHRGAVARRPRLDRDRPTSRAAPRRSPWIWARADDPYPHPHTRQVRCTAWIEVERSERMPLAVVRDGLPLAPV